MENQYVNPISAWKKTTKNGDTFLSLSIKVEDLLKVPQENGYINLPLFKNNKKEKDTHPDYRASYKLEQQQATYTGETVDENEDLPF